MQHCSGMNALLEIDETNFLQKLHYRVSFPETVCNLRNDLHANLFDIVRTLDEVSELAKVSVV